jgi:hypothetical protein
MDVSGLCGSVFFRPSGGHAVHLWGDVRSANFDFHGNLIGRFENGITQ